MKGNLMDRIAVERSIWIKASIERVWSAITDPQQLSQWLLPPALGAQLQQNGDTLAVMMGPMSIELALLEQVDRPRRVSLRGLPDKLISANFALDSENGGTRVTVALSGFEMLPEKAAQERLRPSGAGWEKALQNLKATIDGAALPYPEGYLTELLGYRRETDERLAVERSIWIKASIERVWAAITEPEQLGKWFSPGVEWRGSGLKVGGVVSIYDPAAAVETPLQVIDLVEPPHRLVTHSTPESTPTTFITEWTLAEENGGTRLTITYSGYQHEALDTRHNSIEQTGFGFGMMLENVKASAEDQPLPYPGGF